MNYDLKTPCPDCPFLEEFSQGFSLQRLDEFSSGQFPCHKTAVTDEESGEFVASGSSQHCAGALIYLESQGRSNQMMRIAERLGIYDRNSLNMKAPVRKAYAHD